MAVVLAALTLVLAVGGAVAPAARVAVVGGGIAGAATAHYLQEFLRNASLPPATITVFERSAIVGGRLKHATIGPGGETSVEVGGAAWTSNNQHMVELANAVGINHTTTAATLTSSTPIAQELGVWDGSAFAGVESLLVRRALGLARVAAAEEDFLAAINESYAQQSLRPFETVGEFLSWGRLSRFTSVSIAEFFRSRGVPEDLIQQGMVPLTRAIYNRNGEANAFALLASLTAELSHHQVRGGNALLVRALLERAAATVKLNTTVHEIGRSSNHFTLQYDGPVAAAGGGDAPSAATAVFDRVIIAAPLERTGIRITGGRLPPTTHLDRGFSDWYVTVVEAEKINTEQFSGGGMRNTTVKLNPADCTVLTTANGTTSAVPYVCLQPLGKHGAGVSKGVFMVYSNLPLAPHLDKLFVGVGQVLVQHWPYTFAALTPITSEHQQLQPVVVMEEGLYNANAVESIASAMEISVIGARNAAQLAARSLVRENGKGSRPGADAAAHRHSE